MSEPYDEHLIGDPAFAELRERQSPLMHAADVRILDHTQKLGGTLAFVVSETRKILGADLVGILFEYPDGLHIAVASDKAEIGRIVPVAESISGQVLSTKQPILVNDLESNPRLRDQYYPRVEMGPEDRPPRLSVLAAGLTLDQQMIGVINVEATDITFRQAHLDFITGVAQHISMAITHAALFDGEDVFRTATDRLLFASPPGGNDTVMREVLEHIATALDSLSFVHTDAAEILFADSTEAELADRRLQHQQRGHRCPGGHGVKHLRRGFSPGQDRRHAAPCRSQRCLPARLP